MRLSARRACALYVARAGSRCLIGLFLFASACAQHGKDQDECSSSSERTSCNTTHEAPGSCTCVLMSRVSSWKTKHRCISDFFTRYETPSAFLKHVVEGGETGELRGLIHSLGLFDDRLQSLLSLIHI